MRLIKTLKKWRDLYYKYVILRKYKIGKNFHLGRNVFIWAKEKVEIGDNCYIGRNSSIETNCIIGDNVLIANNVAIVGRYDHNYQQIGIPIRLASQIRDENYSWKGIHAITIIGSDVWIGYGCIIMSGVHIADGTIVAAGSVVTRDTEPYTIIAGVPARKVKNRFDTEKEKQMHIERTHRDKFFV